MAGVTFLTIEMGRSNISERIAYILLRENNPLTVLRTPANANEVGARSLGGKGEHTFSKAVALKSQSEKSKNYRSGGAQF